MFLANMIDEYVRAGGMEHTSQIKRRALEEAGYLKREWETEEEYAKRMQFFINNFDFNKGPRK